MKISLLWRRKRVMTVLALAGLAGLMVLLLLSRQLSFQGMLILLLPLLIFLVWYCRNYHFQRVRERLTVAGVNLEVIDFLPLCFWRPSRSRALSCPQNQVFYSSIPLAPRRSMLLMRYFQTFTERYQPEKLDRALVLGVAGAALPRYLLEKYPGCRVTGVELSGELIELAKRHFLAGLPMERFELLEADAAEFVRDAAEAVKYDAVYCDLFFGGRPVVGVYSPEFFSKIEKLLAPGGFLMINLLRVTPTELGQVITAMEKGLGYAALLIHGGGKVVTLGGRPELRSEARRILTGRLPGALTLVMDFPPGRK